MWLMSTPVRKPAEFVFNPDRTEGVDCSDKDHRSEKRLTIRLTDNIYPFPFRGVKSLLY